MLQKRPLLYFIALLLLFSAAAIVEARTLHSLSAPDSDDWQHLSYGLWAMQHHALPHLGQGTRFASESLISPGWLFDGQMATTYKVLGLAVIPATRMIFLLCIALLTYLLAGGLYGRVWWAFSLSALAQYCLSSAAVVAGGCSMLLLATLVLLLVAARQSGNVKLLYLLPLLFLLWANVDFQVVYGIIALSSVTAASYAEEWCQKEGWGAASKIPANTMSAALAASVAASLVTPNFFRTYEIFITWVSSPVNQYLQEYNSMAFHRPQDYLLLLLAMGAYVFLGYRRSRTLALPFVLMLSALWSFHARRDAWIVVIMALAVLGDETAELPPARYLHAIKRAGLQALASSVAILVFSMAFISHKPSELLVRAGKAYPVAAAEMIRSQHLPQPLFNALEWGGYLSWALPEYPVTYNADTALYEEQMAVQYYRAMKVDDPPQQLAELQNSGTVLLPKSSILGQVLATSPNYHTVFSDDVAILLVKN